MTKLPNSLSISLWSVGACWAAVAIAYLTDSDPGLMARQLFPLLAPVVLIGALVDLAEWLLKRQQR